MIVLLLACRSQIGRSASIGIPAIAHQLNKSLCFKGG
jgi:hypothetical protein